VDELDLAVLLRAAQQCRHRPHVTTAQALADGFSFGSMFIPPGGDVPAWFHTSLSRLVVAGFLRSKGKRRTLHGAGSVSEIPVLEITHAGQSHLRESGVSD
jgi:hypothetical protein